MEKQVSDHKFYGLHSKGQSLAVLHTKSHLRGLTWHLQLFGSGVNQMGGKGRMLFLYRSLHYKDLAAKRCGFVQV